MSHVFLFVILVFVVVVVIIVVVVVVSLCVFLTTFKNLGNTQTSFLRTAN